jgi:hypothetical protein
MSATFMAYPLYNHLPTEREMRESAIMAAWDLTDHDEPPKLNMSWSEKEARRKFRPSDVDPEVRLGGIGFDPKPSKTKPTLRTLNPLLLLCN